MNTLQVLNSHWSHQSTTPTALHCPPKWLWYHSCTALSATKKTGRNRYFGISVLHAVTTIPSVNTTAYISEDCTFQPNKRPHQWKLQCPSTQMTTPVKTKISTHRNDCCFQDSSTSTSCLVLRVISSQSLYKFFSLNKTRFNQMSHIAKPVLSAHTNHYAMTILQPKEYSSKTCSSWD